MSTQSVIVVNYNGRSDLAPLFHSLAAQTEPADEVIMVDNGSSDGSAPYVREWFPGVHVIELESNLGFTGGNNVGFAEARGDLVALVNSDAVLDPGCLAALRRVLEADRLVGAAVPKIYRARAGATAIPPVLDCAGADFNNLGFCWGRGANQADRGQFDAPREVPALTACTVLLRREAVGDVPLFDPELFMYYEELELSLRLRGRGYRIVYAPDAVVRHGGAKAVRQVAPRPHLFTQFYGNRNRVKILAQYYPGSILLHSLPLIALSLAYWNAVFLREGGPRLFLRAVAAQAHYGIVGLRERFAGNTVAPTRWLPWMAQQGLSDLLAQRAAVGDYTA